MANAAAKKAAAAKASAAKTYNPILLGTNLLYLLLLLGRQRGQSESTTPTPWSFWIGMVLTWALQGYAYVGILDHAESHSSSSSGSGSDNKSLVGGAHLDVLALTWLIQFGTVLWTPKFYWILGIFPPWGGWTLYQNFRGGGGAGAGTNASAGTATADPAAADTGDSDRRKKRAEKRRNKWS